MKKFALTGVAGYIAPRHLKAIKDTGNEVIAAMDPHDSVGILDRYFPEASFFTEFERFDRHLEKLRRGPQEEWVKYVSICSPSYLHDAHTRLALRLGANAICEQPVTLNPWNLDILQEIEAQNSGRVYPVLQLRLHPSIVQLKNLLENSRNSRKFQVKFTYIMPHGSWYHFSWKGMNNKSGGLATNIGVQLFDILIWLFGDVQKSYVHYNDSLKAGGFLELKDADVQWYFSIDKKDIPSEENITGKNIFQSFLIDSEEVNFNESPIDLYNKMYAKILSGKGFGIDDARPSIQLVNQIRNSEISDGSETAHPSVKKILKIEDYVNELL